MFASRKSTLHLNLRQVFASSNLSMWNVGANEQNVNADHTDMGAHYFRLKVSYFQHISSK